ncbi:MAG: hypothetical protein ACOZAQ_06690 [Pseudomonadota bacterium]
MIFIKKVHITRAEFIETLSMARKKARGDDRDFVQTIDENTQGYIYPHVWGRMKKIAESTPFKVIHGGKA